MVVSEWSGGFILSHMLRYCEMYGPFLRVDHGRVPDAVRYRHLNACSAFIHADGLPVISSNRRGIRVP
jgi:hypothetical protein